MPHISIALPHPEELDILELLWQRKVVTDKEFFQALELRRGFNRRRVKTMLAIMEAKGLVTRVQYYYPSAYQATYSKHELQNLLLSRLAETLFHNDMLRLLHTVLVHPELESGRVGHLERTLDALARSTN